MTVCRTTQYVIYVTAYVSIYTLVLMAGDRSAAVMCTLNVFYRRWTAAKYTVIHSYLSPTRLTLSSHGDHDNKINRYSHSQTENICMDKESLKRRSFWLRKQPNKS